MELVFATQNQNKVKEIQALLPKHVKILSLTDIGCTDDIPETADTLEGNAQLKAAYVTSKFGVPCFADDTGLEVRALQGAPGVFSARYAGPEKSSAKNMEKLLGELSRFEDRSAQFRTVIALTIDGQKHVFEGICKGLITPTKRGDQGFGYDPIFQPDHHNQTFAEMAMEAKNKISHRALAV